MDIVESGNVGDIERLVRVVSGVMMIALCFIGPTSIWGLAGVYPLITGIGGDCPVYTLLGISTRRSE